MLAFLAQPLERYYRTAEPSRTQTLSAPPLTFNRGKLLAVMREIYRESPQDPEVIVGTFRQLLNFFRLTPQQAQALMETWAK